MDAGRVLLRADGTGGRRAPGRGHAAGYRLTARGVLREGAGLQPRQGGRARRRRSERMRAIYALSIPPAANLPE